MKNIKINHLYKKLGGLKKKSLDKNLTQAEYESEMDSYYDYLDSLIENVDDSEAISRLEKELNKQGGNPSRGRWLTPVVGIVAVAIIAIGSYSIFYPGRETKDDKTTQTSNSSSEGSSQTLVSNTDIKDDSFFLQSELTNAENKILKNGSSENSLASGEGAKVSEELLNIAVKDDTALRFYAKNFGIDGMSEDMTYKSEKDGKEYLNQNGRDLYTLLKSMIGNDKETANKFVVSSIPDSNFVTAADVVVTGEGTTGYNSGIVNDTAVVNSQPSDLSGRTVLRLTFADGRMMYISLYCGNVFYSAKPSNMPEGDVPVPPRDTETPPNAPTPLTPPTPETPTTPEPKDISKSPQRNPEVIEKDTDNIRPGANGAENATVDTSPGTANQGSQADVTAAKDAATAAAKAAEETRKAQEAADAAKLAEETRKAEEAAKRAAEKAATEEQKKQNQKTEDYGKTTGSSEIQMDW